MSLKEQWNAAVSEEAKLAFLAQFADFTHPIDHMMLGCGLDELDAVAEKAGFALIWIRGSSYGVPGEPDGRWQRAACVSAKFAYLHPLRTVHVERMVGWSDGLAAGELVSCTNSVN